MAHGPLSSNPGSAPEPNESIIGVGLVSQPGHVNVGAMLMAIDHRKGRAQSRPDLSGVEMARDDDYAEHERTYRGFLTVLQLAIVAIAVILILLVVLT